MVNKCSAFGCKSGYPNSSTPDTVTFHCYPLNNPSLLKKWNKANPRKQFEPTKYSRICSLHFTSEDFVETTQDSNVTRKEKKDQLIKRYLKQDAVPTIFPNAPAYLSTVLQAVRSTHAATSSARLEAENTRLNDEIADFFANDSILNCSLQEIQELLDTEETRPVGFQTAICSEFLCIFMLEMKHVCQVACSICIGPNHNVSVGINGTALSQDKIVELVGTDGKVSSISEVVNLMARVKNLKEGLERAEQESSDAVVDTHFSHFVDMAHNNLTSALEHKEDRSVTFIREQLQLSSEPKTSRRYSQQLLVLCYMIYSISAAAYGFLREQEILCLPSERTLRSVTRRIGKDGLDSQSYLRLRASKLTQMERVVMLIIDEIYVANRIEYCGGQVSGLDNDGVVASTYCCFLIKSIAGKYKDMVSMFPVSKLTAQKLNHWFQDVMELLRSLQFSVIAISVDNAPVNRKFVTDFLCDGELKESITDKATGQPIFIVIDPVYNLKNIYNNFQTRKSFSCPAFPPILTEACDAHFSHIVELFNAEVNKPVRLAHKLNHAVLNPKNIEKSSVKLAVAVFCDSTRDALKYYTTHENKNWSGTASFVSAILKLWKVLNVKTASKGLRKRDIAQDPVRSSLDWKLQFLDEFSCFLKLWQSSGASGLSKETFLACRITCRSIAACARHLLDHEGFSYVLLGSLQSDSLERRFGWLRTLSGANHFISARQLIENNRKIAAISLLKFSQLSLADIDNALDPVRAKCQRVKELAREFASMMEMSIQPLSSDCTIIYYVSGAVARKFVQRKRGCASCRELLLGSDDLPPLETDGGIQATAIAFLEEINRGGLSKPSDFAFGLARFCWQVFEEIRQSNELRTRLLQAPNQMQLFCHIVDEMMDDNNYIEYFMGQTMCTDGHDVKEGIVCSFFNCMMKNLVKDISVGAAGARSKRKSAKLASASSDK